MNVMTAAPELPFSFAVHESARRAAHEAKGQCTRPSGLDAESANGALQDMTAMRKPASVTNFGTLSQSL